jgi:glycosyltransferase involved in cell wall biosynthesis
VKKILILAYDFPPYNSIGAQRPASWLKYFPLNEIDTTIVTRHWSRDVASPIDYIKPSENQKESNEEISELSRVIRAPFNPNYRDKLILKYGFEKKIIFRKAVSYIFSYAKFFIKRFDETYSIYKSAEAYIIKNKPDLIIATAEPFILFKHAQKLSEKYHIPWVADYRDCWSNNISAGKKGIFNSTNSLMLSAIEKCIVKKAALITTPSPSYKLKLKELHADKEIEVIYNGFDISNLKLLRDIKPL